MTKLQFYLLALMIFLTHFIFGAISAAPAVLAQVDEQPIGLTVTPGTAYLKVAPGNTALHSITLTNDGLEQIRVVPKLVDFAADGITGQPQLQNSTEFPYLDKDKTSFQPLVLQPNQTAQLTLHFSVPARAENHEFPLTVLFETEPMQSTQTITPSTSLAGTIGSNLVLLVSSEQQPTAKLSVLDWQTWPVTDSFGQIAAKPILFNDNYAASVASGSATIKNWRGQTVATEHFEPQVILAESSRQLDPLTYDSPFLIGPYTIELTLVQPQANGASAHMAQTTVIAFPFSILITIILIAATWWGYQRWQKSRVPF